MNKLTIIDFSSLLYSTCYNCSVDKDKADNFEEYRNTLDFYVQNIFDDTKADFYIAFGDDYTCFRKDEFKEYKADRASKDPLKFITDLRLYAIKRYNIIINDKLEADDMCLITANLLGDKYDVTIASKDGDLRQMKGLFYNYGWRQAVYKKYKVPSNKQLKEGLRNAFETLSEDQGNFKLWAKVLVKGHNYKYHYLVRCGDVTAEKYLATYPTSNRMILVLRAFVNGIKSTKTNNIKQSVKGYGLLKGIDYFNKAFRQTYLLQTVEEARLVGSDFEVPVPIDLEKDINNDF